jgi:hypothetical protein
MGIETKGKLHIIFETKQVSERFTKREFVVEITDNPKYPQMVLFQLTGDRCALLDPLNVGDDVAIEFSLRGREWKSPSGEVKYFNSLDCWSVQAVGERKATRAAAPSGASPGYVTNPQQPDDDIPFATCDIAHEPTPIARVLR